MTREEEELQFERCKCCDAEDEAGNLICDGCGNCADCCNCTETDCDCESCEDRRKRL